MNQKEFYELMRLAHVAGSEAAEAEMDNIELGGGHLDSLPKIDAYFLLNGNRSLVRLFKKYGQVVEKDNSLIYIVDHVYITKWKGSIGYQLRVEHSCYERREQPIVLKAYQAIAHLLAQIDNTVQIIETNERG